MPVTTSKTPIGRVKINLKLVVCNEVQEEEFLRNLSNTSYFHCSHMSLEVYMSILMHALHGVFRLDDLQSPFQLDCNLILWGVGWCYWHSVRAEMYFTVPFGISNLQLNPCHSLADSSTTVSSTALVPLPKILPRDHWLLRDLTDT